MSYKRPLSEPIAIVGSSCRFTSTATSPAKLWELLLHPVDLSREVPMTRFNATAFYHADGEYHGATNSTLGYWMDDDHWTFDAQFFNITPKEAEAMDPQQRLVLEVVYEALESAGCTLHTWAGRNVAVYAGLMTGDHEALSQRDDIFDSQYYATGNARSILSNRISYFFDFRGASMTIDTACSASLVALHQAVQSLRSGESQAAIVAGANLILTPEQFITESSLHMLSPTGRCRMWDASADGYARGEGIAAMFLKPLSQALANGDTIQALVRETGVNSDGKTQGITTPNPSAQAALIINTYKKSGLNPKDPQDRCQYFEAHGTGTPVGDPLEAAAIHEAFFSESEKGGRLVVGSIKTVIGHTEGAAGLAGVLKAVHAIKNGCIPPNLHLKQLNPKIEPFSEYLRIPTSSMEWPAAPGQPRRASVNSFGFGGANAHVILELYEERSHDPVVGYLVNGTISRPSTRSSPMPQDFHLPFVVSANSQPSLVAFCQQLLEYVAGDITRSSNQIAWNLYKYRTTFPVRNSIPAANLTSGLVQVTTGEASSDRVRNLRDKPRVLGVFTGQGAQWATMGTGLLGTNSVFARCIRNLEKILQSCPNPPSWYLERELLAPESVSLLGKAEISQPLCTAVQIGLVDLLRSIGVEFHAVVGHSSGEIAAAYAAGKLSAKNAMLISYYRGLVACLAGGKNGEPGAMIATSLSREKAEHLCSQPEYRGAATLAASNSSSSTTISGDMDVISQIQERLRMDGVFVTRLRVDTAYHSHHMLRPAEEYLHHLQGLEVSSSDEKGPTWVSSVASFRETGKQPSSEHLQAQYWVENMVEPVLFHEALLETLRRLEFDCIIEVGPRSQLKSVATQTMRVADKSIPYTGVLDRKKADPVAFSDFLGEMWTKFGPSSINLEAYIEAAGMTSAVTGRLELPSYPWDHSEKYRRESRISRQYRFREDLIHELLGVRTRDDAPNELRWRNYLKVHRIPWAEHHKFQGGALLPASAYCVMALDAGRALLRGRQAALVELSDLKFESGISLERDADGVEILFSLSVDTHSRDESTIKASFNVTFCPGDGNSSMNAKPSFSGNLVVILGDSEDDILPQKPEIHAETLPADPEIFYAAMAEVGLAYTGPFRSLETIRRRYNFASATLPRSHPEDSTTLDVSPATLDSCFQTVFAAFASPGDRYVPIATLVLA